ncbi:FAD-dependent monooxygenase [Microbispora sp. NEAU-D428]|uniref:FAD-dependent oxidoreductase n=1 Tax=Microbispora sitophila TaxID=2771537 RepID=UPI001868F282|nr:FAD-dependent monooxygenase [Microbispora sitophila]MBE3008183.1 FAD-dependent monooxygenase [Microbispora sitophila]
MPEAPQVVIIGGGLGGLCAAHGLRTAGIGVTVHERDPSPDYRPQGYRLHLDSRGAGALRECLPPRLYELFTATAGLPSRRVTVVDERLRELHGVTFDGVSAGDDPATFSAPVDRMVLRQVLLAGLDGVVRYDAEFTRYEHEGERVRAWFADGSSVMGDVLVGADGIGSRVRGQMLPHARIKDLGTRCVYGRTLLDEQMAGLLPPRLHEGFMSVRSGRAGLALGLVRLREDPARAAARLWPGLRPYWPGDYVMWALTVDARELPGTGAEPSAAALHEFVKRRIATWHPNLVALVAAAEVAQTFCVAISSSVPVGPWRPSNVTVLGDAVHAMSPAQGSGANCALLDAAVLCRALSGAVTAGLPLAGAIGDYERRMTDYGFAAVRASERAAEARSGPLSRTFARLGRLLR